MFLHSDSHSSLKNTKEGEGVSKESGRRQGKSQPCIRDRDGLSPEAFPSYLCSQILCKGWILTCTRYSMKVLAALEKMEGDGKFTKGALLLGLQGEDKLAPIPKLTLSSSSLSLFPHPVHI